MSYLAPPPRHVPLGVAVRQLFGRLRYQVSWLFFGLVAVFFFGLAFDSSSFLLSLGKIETVFGTLVERQETVLTDSVVGSGGILHRRGGPLYRYVYRYAAGGVTYQGDSFERKKSLEAGAAVNVEYLAGRPCVSRIQGMSSELHLGGGVAPLVIVLVIILIVAFSVFSMTRKRLRSHYLMRTGAVAEATAKSMELLSRTRHGREWYQVSWEFEAEGGRHTMQERPYYTDRVTVGERRTLLYDRKDPGKALLLDRVPVFIGGPSSHTATILSTVRVVLMPLGSAIAILASIYLEFSC